MISRGHSFGDLLREYTMDQVFLFLEAARENEKSELLDFATGVRMALGASKEGWRDYVNSLSRTKKKPKQSSKEEIERARRLLSGKRRNRATRN